MTATPLKTLEWLAKQSKPVPFFIFWKAIQYIPGNGLAQLCDAGLVDRVPVYSKKQRRHFTYYAISPKGRDLLTNR